MSADPVAGWIRDFQQKQTERQQLYDLACGYYHHAMLNVTASDIYEAVWGTDEEFDNKLQDSFRKGFGNTFYEQILEKVRQYEWSYACRKANLITTDEDRPDWGGK